MDGHHLAGAEDIHLRDYATVPHLEAGLQRYFAFHNHERPHQSVDYTVPGRVHQGMAALVCSDGTLTYSAPFVLRVDRGHGGRLGYTPPY